MTVKLKATAKNIRRIGYKARNAAEFKEEFAKYLGAAVPGNLSIPKKFGRTFESLIHRHVGKDVNVNLREVEGADVPSVGTRVLASWLKAARKSMDISGPVKAYEEPSTKSRRRRRKTGEDNGNTLVEFDKMLRKTSSDFKEKHGTSRRRTKKADTVNIVKELDIMSKALARMQKRITKLKEELS